MATSTRLPRQAQLLTTERCNLSCRHCAVPEEDSPAERELDAPAWRRSIDDLLSSGVGHIWFTGGEPLLRKDVPELIRHALERGAERVVVVTNGTVFTEARARAYAELCRSYPRFAIHLSLDGAGAATHDQVRGPGSWQRTMDGVARLRAHGGSIRVVQTTLMEGNAHEVAQLPDLIAGVGARGLHLFSMAEVGRARALADEHCPSATWRGALEVLARMEASGCKVSVQGPLDGEDWPAGHAEVPQAAGRTTPTVVVGPDGDLFPCPFLRHVEIGNVTDRSALPDAIARLGEVTERACPTCRYLPMCAGLDLDRPFAERTGRTSHPHEHFPLGAVPVVLR